MWSKEEYVWSSSVFTFIIFGAFVYTLGMIMAASINSSGIYWMIIGIVIALIVPAFSFIFYKKPFLTAVSSIGCFTFAGWNLTKYQFLDNMEEAQQEINALGGVNSSIIGDFPTLRFINTITIIIFISIGMIESIFSVYLYKKFGKEWKQIRYGHKFKIKELDIREDKPSISVELMKFKYCPRCLYQVKIDSEEKICPKCNIEFKSPELTPS